MENLERLASSVAQVELLVASLKRENRDLAARLAQAASERRQAVELGVAEAARLQKELDQARLEQRNDPGLEARAHQAELESADLARQLDVALRSQLDDKARFEALVRQLEAQLLGTREHEQLPTASVEALQASEASLRGAEAALREAKESARSEQERADHLAFELKGLHARLDATLEAEAQAVQAVEALKARLADQERRITGLESHSIDLERELSEAQQRLAGSVDHAEAQALQLRIQALEGELAKASGIQALSDKMEAEKADLRKQRRELAGMAKERQTLRRKVEELVATLESVRLG